MTTLSIKKSIDRSSLRCGLILAGVVLTLLAFSAPAHAACQDGCDTNFNAFLGDDALVNNTTGSSNAAIGERALTTNTTGSSNTAAGSYALYSNTSGFENTATGDTALYSNTTGYGNTATGDTALNSNTTGYYNTADGVYALWFNTTASYNTAVGFAALEVNTTGNDNTATGVAALGKNTTGSRNVAAGYSALGSNQIGIDNTATGYNALAANTADYNTATGYQALESNTTGTDNTAHGIDALNLNTSGSYNTANGALALFNNSAGANNTATGFDALYYNTNGPFNTANGFQALYTNTIGANNTADGAAALSNTTGSNNIAVGFQAGFNLTDGSNNIDIGNTGSAGESKTIRIGTKPSQKNTYVAGIFGVTVPTGVAVLVDSTGHLGTTTSSARFKEGIKPMDKASEAILSLKPVTFHYRKELDPDVIPQFGLVAEEVEKVNPDLVTRDDEGKPYTVRYEAVNAMLLNEFLKEHRKVEGEALKNRQQEAAIAELKSRLGQQGKEFQTSLKEERKEIQVLTVALKEQAAQIRKVAEVKKIEANVSASEMMAGN